MEARPKYLAMAYRDFLVISFTLRVPPVVSLFKGVDAGYKGLMPPYKSQMRTGNGKSACQYEAEGLWHLKQNTESLRKQTVTASWLTKGSTGWHTPYTTAISLVCEFDKVKSEHPEGNEGSGIRILIPRNLADQFLVRWQQFMWALEYRDLAREGLGLLKQNSKQDGQHKQVSPAVQRAPNTLLYLLYADPKHKEEPWTIGDYISITRLRERPLIGVAAALPHTTAASPLRFGSRAAGRFQA
jgi:hypothetical protein